MSKRKYIYMLLFFSLVLLFSAYFLFTKEGFEDQQSPMENQLNEAMTFFSEVLCPTHKVILEDAMAGKEGSDAEKRISAEFDIQKTAGGPLFSCPPPNDPVQIPADIATRIQRTLDFFSKKLQQMKKDVTTSLSQCPNTTVEGFQEACPPPPGQTTTPPDPKSLNPAGCKPVQSIDIQTRQEILKTRYSAVSTLVNDPKVATTLAQIKADSDELLELKRKAEKGELTPNCPPI
jgi:hypothetical protein